MAAYGLLRSGDLAAEEYARLRSILDWHVEHLPTPPKKFYASRAVFWFCGDAEENIRQIWELVLMLREHGFPVSLQRCERLGNVVYRDAYQVAAYPSEQDAKIRTG